VDVLDLVGPVVLGAPFQMRVPDHADVFQHGHGSVHGRGVHGGQPPLYAPGHVLRSDVPPALQDLRQDGLSLWGDPVAALSEHADDRSGLIVHAFRLLQERCR
jgi:hypothetical protein